jgi:hypothetical protein
MPQFSSSTGRFTAVLSALLCVGAGCTGQVGPDPNGPPGPGPGPGGPGNPGPGGPGNPGPGNPGPGNPGPGNPGPGNPMNPPPPPGAPNPQLGNPGEMVFRRLTKVEYNNTVRDLLGDNTSPANNFPPDLESAHSGFARGGSIAAVDAGRLLDATEKLAATAMTRLADLVPCKPIPAAAADQDRCAAQFITQFGLRAFRRPLAADESKAFTDYYARLRMTPGTDFPNAMRMVISAFLMSPNTLYRWETAPRGQLKDGQLLRFNAYEVASRLSYTYWASMPDQALFDAAAANRLSTPEQIEAEARRMVRDPKAKDAFVDFFIQWMGVGNLAEANKNTTVFRGWNPAVAQSMLAETREFVTKLVTTGDGKFETLLTSVASFVDQNLAANVYKMNGVTGNNIRPANHDATQRAGLLTQAAFLTAHATTDESHPVKRGVQLAERLLCIEPPLPPPDVPNPKPPAPGLTTRERYAEHGAEQCAFACHSIFDPLGFAFENYDAIGGWRTMDMGKPVDATGILKADGVDKPFKNAIELSAHIAQSKQVRDCMSRQWVRYALKRKEGMGDEPSIAAVQHVFRTVSDVRELAVSLARTRAFTHRSASAGELLP